MGVSGGASFPTSPEFNVTRIAFTRSLSMYSVVSALQNSDHR